MFSNYIGSFASGNSSNHANHAAIKSNALVVSKLNWLMKDTESD